MSQIVALNRRIFLKGAGMTALAGALGTGGNLAAPQAAAATRSAFDFDEVYNRVGTDCSKWDYQMERFEPHEIVVAMGVADMDFRTAPAITSALRKRLEHENWGYLHLPESFKQSIADWNRRRYGEEIDPDLILNATGVIPAIDNAIRAFAPPGSKVILQSPVYSSFYSSIKRVGCVVDENPLKPVDGRYQMDFEDLERRIDHDTHVLILCNPHNPTGNCWSPDDLKRLGEICTRRRVVVFADEIHCDFVNKGHRYTPYTSIDDEDIVRNSVSFKSTSKSFNTAALKAAYMYSGNADYIERIKATGHSEYINTLGAVGCQAAYDEGEEWLNELITYIDGNMDRVAEFVDAEMEHVSIVKPQGTYLAWLDFSEFGEKIGAAELAAEYNARRDPEKPELAPTHMIQQYLVEKAGVYLNDGHRYGHGGDGNMRMNLATCRQLVDVALERIADVTKKV